MSREFGTGANTALRGVIESLCAEAVSRHGVPHGIACEAGRVALRRFEHQFVGVCDSRERTRVTAYFRGALRRRVVASRGPELKELRSRFMLCALAEDLKVTGRSGRDIYLEIAHDHAAHADPAALRALEHMLCG